MVLQRGLSVWTVSDTKRLTHDRVRGGLEYIRKNWVSSLRPGCPLALPFSPLPAVAVGFQPFIDGPFPWGYTRSHGWHRCPAWTRKLRHSEVAFY